MCGLVGMAGNLNLSHTKMFRDMLIFDQVRGFDSTGVAVVGMTAGALPVVEKVVGTPENLWAYGDSKLMDLKGHMKACPKVIIGHNRAATVGKVLVENAHPFEFDHIVGVHNGSLTYWDDLEGAKTHEVDSMAIFDTISKKGIEHTWKSFYGAAALIWWDSKEDTLNIIRNSQRPLYVVQSEAGDAIFWASEAWMILAAAERHSIKLKRNESEKVVIASPKENHLYVYQPTALKCTLKEVRELEKKTYTPPATTYGGGNTHGRAGFYSSTSNAAGRGGYGGYFDALPWRLKTGWAADCERAPKDQVGKAFKIVTVVDTQENGYRGFYIFGQTEDGSRVEVYPVNPDEYASWKERTKYANEYEIWFKFTRRPRVRKIKLTGYTDDTKDRNEYMTQYRAGTESVAFSHSLPRKGVTQELNEQLFLEFKEQKEQKEAEETGNNVVNLTPNKLYKAYLKSVSEKMWYELMSHPDIDNGCTACGNPIGIEQHRDIYWVSDRCVLCETCKQDPTITNYLQTFTG